MNYLLYCVKSLFRNRKPIDYSRNVIPSDIFPAIVFSPSILNTVISKTLQESNTKFQFSLRLINSSQIAKKERIVLKHRSPISHGPFHFVYSMVDDARKKYDNITSLKVPVLIQENNLLFEESNTK